MRVELDEPLSKTKLRQVLKMCKGQGVNIKVVCGADIFDIDTITTKDENIYLHTNSKQTVDYRLNHLKNKFGFDDNEKDK